MSKPRILIIDDDRAFTSKLAGTLEGLFRVEMCHSEEAFWGCYASGRYDLLIVDIRLRVRREGLDLLKEVLACDPGQAAIMMTAYADTDSYVEAITSGALTYLDKKEFSPFLIARTVEAVMAQVTLRRRLATMERRLEAWESQEMIGTGEVIERVSEQLRQAAEDGEIPVLLLGEPGSGRTLAARTLHRLSRRRADGPFVLARCRRSGSVRSAAELLGTVRPSDDGSVREVKGLVDDARGGVLYLDGVVGFDAVGRAAIAELIATKRFIRVGASRPLHADEQVVVSLRPSERDFGPAAGVRDAVSAGGGMEIRIPPLRERREDIPLIAHFFLQRLYRLGQTQARSFRGAALAALESQLWPGNVRELKSAIEYAAIRADSDGAREISIAFLPVAVIEGGGPSATTPSTLDYQAHLVRAELGLVESAIERFETTKKSVLAERLRYNDRFTFSRRIRKGFAHFPGLRNEFPRTAELFYEGKSRPSAPGESKS